MGLGCQMLGEAGRGGGVRGRKHTRQCGTGQRTGRNSIIFRFKFIILCNIQGDDRKQCLVNTSVNVKRVKELKEFGFHININFLKF